MNQDLSLKVLLKAQDSASGVMKGFGSTLQNLAGKAGPLLGGMLAVGAAVVGIGVKATQMAADYQQQMNMVQALTGSNAQQMSYYDTQVKQLAMDAGVAPTKLASGLYNVLSASYSGADAMKILTLATEDSKIGMTDAATTSNALTNVLRTFGTATKDATRVNGEMLETVTLGKSTFAQYATSVTKAASTSKQFGVNMETMNAAWSTLTSTGISAGQATTDYSALLRMMDANIGTVTKSLHKNGIAFDETKFNAMSFGDKVQYLNKVLQTATDKHVHITGATVQASQAIQAISGHIGTYNSNLKTLSNSQEMNNKTAGAWATTQAGFNQTLSRAQASVQVLFIDIGQALLPVLTKLAASVIPLISKFGDWITKSGILQQISDGLTTGINLLGVGITKTVGFVTGLVTGISNVVGWFQKGSTTALVLRDALIAVGAAIAIIKLGNLIADIPKLIAQMGIWITTTWAKVAAEIADAAAEMAANWPIYLIIAAILILIGIIVLLVQHWSQVTKFLQDAWNLTVKAFQMGLQALGQFFATIWSSIVEFFKTHIALIIAIVTGPLGALVVLIVTHWSQIVGFFQNLWKNIETIFTNFSLMVGKKVLDLVNNIKKFFSDLPGNVAKIGQDMITGLANIIKNGAATLIQDAKNMASGIAGGIASFLHFSKPDTGPLASVNEWMPHFGEQISTQMKAQLPKIQTSAHLIASGIASSANPPALVGSGVGVIPYGRPPAAGNSYSNSSGNVHNGDIVIHAPAGSNPDAIAKAVMDKLNSAYRRSGVMSNLASGGRSS